LANPIEDEGFFHVHQTHRSQLAMLSKAAQHEDRCLVAPPMVKGGAAEKAANKLISFGFVKKVKAKAETAVWRRNTETGQAYPLRLTAEGVKAIAVKESPALGLLVSSLLVMKAGWRSESIRSLDRHLRRSRNSFDRASCRQSSRSTQRLELAEVIELRGATRARPSTS
jgi:hypothetical protein